MTYRVIIQPTAEAELEAVYRRIRDHAPAAAARWFNGMVEAINTLAFRVYRRNFWRQTTTVCVARCSGYINDMVFEAASKKDG